MTELTIDRALIVVLCVGLIWTFCWGMFRNAKPATFLTDALKKAVKQRTSTMKVEDFAVMNRKVQHGERTLTDKRYQ